MVLSEESISFKESQNSSLLAYNLIGLFEKKHQDNVRIMDKLYILGGQQSLSVAQTILMNKD